MTTSQVGNTHCHFYNQFTPDLMCQVSGETNNYRHKLKLKMSDMRSSEKRGNNNVTVISHNQDDENFKKLLLQLLLNYLSRPSSCLLCLLDLVRTADRHLQHQTEHVHHEMGCHYSNLARRVFLSGRCAKRTTRRSATGASISS